MTRLLRLFPKEWRQRYGDEVTEMLAMSTRPWRDRADLVAVAALVRAERIGSMRILPFVAALLIAAGVAGGIWSSTQLADGFAEIAQHWWSTLAVLPAAVGAAVAVAVRIAHRH